MVSLKPSIPGISKFLDPQENSGRFTNIQILGPYFREAMIASPATGP